MLSRIILVPHSYEPESPFGYIITCLKKYLKPPRLFSFIPFYFSVLAAWSAHNSLAWWIAYKVLSKIRFLFTTVFFCFVFFMQSSITSRSTNTFFSHLAGAQFADCITCLTTLLLGRKILFWFPQTIPFVPFRTYLTFTWVTCLNMFHSQCSIYLLSFHPFVLPQA